MRYRAVIFDLGGVVLGSPLDAIARYERGQNIPAGFVNQIVRTTGATGAWARLERGELSLEDFYPAFDRECETAGSRISARALIGTLAASSAPRPSMLAAVRRIREHGLSAAALTNNWSAGEDGTGTLRPHFDVVIESSVVGLRKPDPRIFRLACERLRIEPREAVFLDDLGNNLKTARALGMTTIKVADPDAALEELQSLLGFALR